MTRFPTASAATTCLCVFVSGAAFAATPINAKFTIERAERAEDSPTKLALPYLFSTETMGFNAGIGGMVKGTFQEEFTMGATAYGGPESYGVGVGFWNLRIPKTERFYLSGLGYYGYFPEQRAYTSTAEPIPAGQPLPGSSGSSKEDSIVGSGFSNSAELKLEYVLPIGSHRSSPTLNYTTRGGMLTNAKPHQAWNPFENGSTIAMLRSFYYYQSYDGDDIGEIDGNSQGLELGIQYDNTDFVVNPSIGSRQFVSFQNDGEILGEDRTWSAWQFDTSHFWSLERSEWARQRTFALNFWTAYSPSWRVDEDANGAQSVENAPPFNLGASLGGWDRMRGYESNRFHDKAAIYSSLEYRYTLDYNPTSDMAFLKLFQIDWFQLVPFVEVGNVASEYRLDELTDDIKYDAGLSARMMAASTILRADWATSPEGSTWWVMVGHPF